MRRIDINKADLRSFVKKLIVEKIQKQERFLEFTLEASRDLKKTAKYDSIREEVQEEIYQMQRQLGNLYDLHQKMLKVIWSPTDIIQKGSIIITNKARFYICVSLGEFFYMDHRFYAISAESPMAQMMMGRSVGDEFVLNNIHQKIEEVF